MLPDAETMRERMLALAYEEGMVDGVEARTAGLVQNAIEVRPSSFLSAARGLSVLMRPVGTSRSTTCAT